MLSYGQSSTQAQRLSENNSFHHLPFTEPPYISNSQIITENLFVNSVVKFIDQPEVQKKSINFFVFLHIGGWSVG